MAARAAAIGTVTMIVVAGLFARSGAGPAFVATMVALAFLPYAWLLVAEVPWDERRALLWSFALAALAGAVLVAAPTLLSDDLYRYLWDGRISSHGLDPYRYAPDDPALFALRDALYARVNNPEIPTIYPPVAQLLFWVADGIDHAPWTLKALALGAHLVTIPVVSRLAGPEHASRAALLYGLNPLVLVESALGGHVDVVAGLALVAFALSLRQGHGGRAALLAAVATGVKLVGLVVAPLIALRERRTAAVAVLLGAAVAAPIFFAGTGSGAVAGVGHYARRWQGNAGLFAVLESGARAAVDHVAEENWNADDHIRLPGLSPVVAFLEGTPLDPWATQIAEKKEAPDRTDFQRAYVASMLARGAALALVLALVFWAVRRRVEPLLATRWVILAVLLLAPQIHPWYLLWLVPLEVASGRAAGLIFSATVLMAYAPLSGWLLTRTWAEVPGTALLIHGPVLILVALELVPELQRRFRPSWPRLGLGKIQ